MRLLRNDPRLSTKKIAELTTWPAWLIQAFDTRVRELVDVEELSRRAAAARSFDEMQIMLDKFAKRRAA